MTLFITFMSFLLQQIIGNINDTTMSFEEDKDKIEQIHQLSNNGRDYLIYILELYCKTPVTDNEVAEILKLQKEDGSWTDINYKDRKVSQCEQTLHALRFQRLAIYRELHPDRNDVANALHAALAYWGKTMPVCKNWFYNEINIPKAFAPGFLLFLDEMSETEREIAIAQMSRAKANRTGQNQVWEAGNLLIAGILKGDEEQVRKMATIIQSELKISDSEEGLQKDLSFLQHGAQLQFGNYGQSFAQTQSYWIKALKGTGIDYPENKISILKDYITKGAGRTIWNGYMDQNAIGRQIFPNSQVSKSLAMLYAMENLGLTMDDIENGPRYYPRADYCNYRSAGWYASLRMQSARTIGYEATNNENMKGYFSADGALLVRRNGDEYLDIAPVWNWRHIPGTTVYDDGKELWGTHKRLPYNKSPRVFGDICGDVMVVAMEYDRDSVKAKKIWAFNKDMILCIGDDISSLRNGDEIITTVEQSRLLGPVESGRSYIRHNGITYISLDKPFTSGGKIIGKGNWTAAAAYYGNEEITADMFEITISHGTDAKDGNYRYCIVPTGIGAKEAIRLVKKGIKVHSSTKARIGDTVFEVNWNENKIIFNK